MYSQDPRWSGNAGAEGYQSVDERSLSPDGTYLNTNGQSPPSGTGRWKGSHSPWSVRIGAESPSRRSSPASSWQEVSPLSPAKTLPTAWRGIAKVTDDLPEKCARQLVADALKWMRVGYLMCTVQAVAIFLESTILLADNLNREEFRWANWVGPHWDAMYRLHAAFSPYGDCINPVLLGILMYQLRAGLCHRGEVLVKSLATAQYASFELDDDGKVDLEQFKNVRTRMDSRKRALPNSDVPEHEAVAVAQKYYIFLYPHKRFFHQLFMVLFFLTLPRSWIPLKRIVSSVLTFYQS